MQATNGIEKLRKLAADIRQGHYKESPIDSLITSFAETHSLNRETVQQFAEELIALTKPKTRNPEQGGKATQKALDLCRRFLERKAFPPSAFTTKEAMPILQASQTDTSNCLRYYESQGIVKRKGYKENEEGQRGRKQIIWKLCVNRV